MSDRRRAPRYTLNTPLPAQARPMQDTVVEQLAGDRLVVLSPSTRQPSEDLMVHVATPDAVDPYAARVITSTPLAVEGTVTFRLELHVEPVADIKEDE